MLLGHSPLVDFREGLRALNPGMVPRLPMTRGGKQCCGSDRGRRGWEISSRG
jgi:hypothetical protein